MRCDVFQYLRNPRHKLWVLGDASFAPTGEKSQQGQSIMVSPRISRKVVTLSNGDLADKIWLPNPLVSTLPFADTPAGYLQPFLLFDFAIFSLP